MRAVLEHNAADAEATAAALAAHVGVDEVVAFGLENPGYLRAFLAVQLADDWDEDIVPRALPILERAAATLTAEQARLGLRDPALSPLMAIGSIGALLAAWWVVGPLVAGREDAPAGSREQDELREAARAIWARALTER